MSLRDRVRELMDIKGVTAYDIWAATGISQSTLSRLKTDLTAKPNLKNLKKLADYFEVSEDWLRTGNGEPFPLKNSKEEIRILNTQEMISRLIAQNDDLIGIVKHHSVTIEKHSETIANLSNQLNSKNKSSDNEKPPET